MKGIMNKSLVSVLVSGVALGLALVGCDQKPSSGGSGTTGGTTAPAGSAKSLPGKVVETSKDVVNRANEAGKKVGEAADTVGDTAKGAWADLRSKAASEGEKRLSSLKEKIKGFEATNPAMFTSLNGAVKGVEAKIAELKGAGADTWQSLSEQVKATLDEIQKRLGV